MKSFRQLVESAQITGEKITRAAFIYFERPLKDFAMCSSCIFYTTKKKCMLLGPKVKVDDNTSCGMYVPGKPLNGPVLPRMTPKEVGLVREQVRCENCTSFDKTNSKCKLYQALNKQTQLFNLDENVKPHGCCNAWN